MKKALIISLLVFVSSMIFAQEKIITPPLGLTFGMNETDFKAVLNKYGTFKSRTSQSYGFGINYNEVKIGSTIASLVIAKFVDNKLFEIGAYYIVDDEDIQSKYNEICQIITTKYGRGEETRNFRYPYKDGDDDFVMAVKGGYTDISTVWVLTNAISVEINKIPAINLIYQSTSLYDIVEKNKNNKNVDQF